MNESNANPTCASTSQPTDPRSVVAGGADPGSPDETQTNAPGSTRPATSQPVSEPAYTFTPRVLDRWSKKNLKFTPTENEGGGDAEFRFHGSTCGNIEFDLLYYVKVGSAAAGWPILAQRCEPEPHGEGHTRMCCWRENTAMVNDWMSREAPLTGEPLAAAFTWNPAKSASGCLCHIDGRMHKWNAVLQTLHFALSKNANLS